jgi:hypothetical protein
MSHDFLRRSHEIGGFSREKEGAQETLSQGSRSSGGARGGTKPTSDRARGKGRPRENRAVQEKRPRGMGMGVKSNLLGVG